MKPTIGNSQRYFVFLINKFIFLYCRLNVYRIDDKVKIVNKPYSNYLIGVYTIKEPSVKVNQSSSIQFSNSNSLSVIHPAL